MLEGMRGLELLIGMLRQVAADPRTRGPLVGVLRGDGELDLHVPPDAAPQSPASFYCAIRGVVQEATASAIGLVVPVRTLWGDEHICPYPDAEALALVAVEDYGDGVASVGLHCPLHALPLGWTEAHDRLRSFAEPLRYALAGRA
jgi:hypothetical protein